MPKPVESFVAQRATFAPKRLALAVLFAFAVGATVTVPPQAQAAGLGRLTVQSGLGQPLRAEIEVTAATADELQSLQVRLASPEAFKQAGLELNAAILSVRVNLERQGANRAVVRLTSGMPINEPYVDLLLEMSWASGRLVREYTFLLDPPELRLGRGAETVPPAVAPAPRVESAPLPPAQAAAPAAPAVRPAPAAPAASRASASEAASGERTVKRGDTLGKIAAQTRPDGVTLDQMLVSLFRANPDAFAGNMNRLKTGAVLRIPDASQAAAIDGGEARRVVSAQTADFAAYRARLAGAVTSGSATAPQGEQRSATGQVTPKVEDQAASKAPGGDQVKLARPQDAAAKGGTGGATEAGAARADALAAKDKALAESRQRIAELERNVNDLQGLLKAQTKLGADAQKAAEAKKAEEAKKLEDAKAQEARKADEVKKAAEAAAKAAPAAPAAEPAKPAEVPAAPPEAAKPAAPVKPAPAPAVPAPEPVAEESLLGNPVVLGGGAAIIALLAGLFFYNRSRKKRFEKFQDSILTGGDLKTNSIFGTTGGQTVDTADSTFNSNFTPSASQIDSNEVDPIAEADVYIAYGRDAQAEEILKEALKNTPDRQAIRVKLLEIYASRRDLPAFEAIAGELYSRTGGKGEDWDKAAALGRSLDPRNPLYGGNVNAATATGVGALAAASALEDSATVPGLAGTAANPVEVDFDLDLDHEPQEPIARGSEATPVDFELGSVGDDLMNKTAASLDFNPTVPMSRTEVSEPGTATTPTVDFDLDAPLLPAEAPAPAPAADIVQAAAAPEPQPAPADTLDFDIQLPEDIEAAAPAAQAAPVAPDLSGISLDLGNGAAQELPSFEPAVAEEAVSGKQQEMATKLDLAAAYQEIGDREGAQELLDEVIRGGDAAQQARARQMLEALG